MTELEARRQLLADPRHVSPELAEAVEADPRLAQLREELQRQDAAMQAALTGAPVPEGLADRLVLHARYGQRPRWGLALAAGLAVLAVAVPGYFGMRDRETEIARDEAIIHHVVAEKGELADNGHVAPAVFRASVTAFGVPVRDSGYRVRHLANCIVAGIESRHFVIEGPRGPISYVILPGAKSGGDEERMLDLGPMRGLFTRRAGFTIGVVGAAGMERAELEQMMRAVLS
jgi:hypothetical protein